MCLQSASIKNSNSINLSKIMFCLHCFWKKVEISNKESFKLIRDLFPNKSKILKDSGIIITVQMVSN